MFKAGFLYVTRNTAPNENSWNVWLLKPLFRRLIIVRRHSREAPTRVLRYGRNELQRLRVRDPLTRQYWEKKRTKKAFCAERNLQPFINKKWLKASSSSRLGIATYRTATESTKRIKAQFKQHDHISIYWRNKGITNVKPSRTPCDEVDHSFRFKKS